MGEESGKVTGHEREGGPRSTKTDEDKSVIFTFYDSFVFFLSCLLKAMMVTHSWDARNFQAESTARRGNVTSCCEGWS